MKRLMFLAALLTVSVTAQVPRTAKVEALGPNPTVTVPAGYTAASSVVFPAGHPKGFSLVLYEPLPAWIHVQVCQTMHGANHRLDEPVNMTGIKIGNLENEWCKVTLAALGTGKWSYSFEWKPPFYMDYYQWMAPGEPCWVTVSFVDSQNRPVEAVLDGRFPIGGQGTWLAIGTHFGITGPFQFYVSQDIDWRWIP